MVRKKSTPISAKNTNVIERLAALKRRLRNTLRSSIGCVVRRSQATKAARIAAPRPNAPRIVPSVQPRSGASMSPHTNAVSPAIESAAPRMSSRGCDGSRDSGTRSAAPARAIATTGRFTRNMLFQLKCSSSQPPVTGPTAMPSPETAAQAAMAFGRSCAGKMFVRMDSVVGMIPAAPRPIRAREAIRAFALSESAARVDPAPKTSRPITSARRRPKRSPRLPAVSSSPAKTSR